jgi:hypothetical protein
MFAHRIRSRPSARALTARQHLGVEQLEDRCLLSSIFTVTNTGDNNGVNPSPGAGTGTLRQAIVDADHFGGGPSTIQFAAGVTGTINLAAVLPDLTAVTDLEGPGANVLTVKGLGTTNFGSIFTVDAGAVVTIGGLTITGGNTTYGGGVLNLGSLTLQFDTISGNTATQLGGGIANDTFPPTAANPTLTVLDSTISGNTVNTNSIGAGGIDVEAGTVTITNCTISGNQAVAGTPPIYAQGSDGAGGIGVYGGSAVIDNCTIADNTPVSGTGNAGGLDVFAPVTLFDTIIARNSGSNYNDVRTGKPNLLTSQGHNLIGVNNVSTPPAQPATGFVASDLVGTTATPENPDLSASPGNNGGPTPTYSFTSNSSPAIAAGDTSNAPASDQRGFVYKATQVKLQRLVAVKMLAAGAHARPDQLARFRREARAAARLRYPNVVQIHEVGEQGGLPFCVLEYVEGGTLAQRLAGNPLDHRAAAELTETLARAMHAAHQAGIIHRDLKPANILLSRSAEDKNGPAPLDPRSSVPKITDFGLARQLGEAGHSITGDVMGTPSYMAPEQAAGRVNEVGTAADVYALGGSSTSA